MIHQHNIPEVTLCLSPVCLTKGSLSFALKTVGMNSAKIPGGLLYKKGSDDCCTIIFRG